MKFSTWNRKWGMIVLALFITGLGANALGDVLFVTTSGVGGSYTSIQAAIADADAGDTIRVAEGTYSENLEVAESVTLEGGWNGIFTDRNFETRLTIIDGQALASVIRVFAGYEVTIDGFVVINGNATTPLGWGGGISIGESFNNAGFTTVRNCVIRDNVASNDSSGQGEGGGIHVYNNSALIENNKIYRNFAQTAADQSGKGGGIATGWNSTVTIRGNEITTNTAALSPTGYSSGAGGGVYTLYGIELTIIEDNVIEGNIGTVDGYGKGGGCHAEGYLKNNRIRNNVASRNGKGDGGGIYAKYVPYIEKNVISNNIASETGDGTGGGIYAVQMQSCRINQILNNTANRGGGIFLGQHSGTSAYHNIISNNKATGNSHATFDGGGGIYSIDNEANIYENVITGNSSDYAGGGIYVYDSTAAIVKNNLIQGNTAMGGGGLNVESSGGAITRNTIRSNAGVFGGGIYVWGSDAPLFDRNIITENIAIGFMGFGGGGGMISLDSTAEVRLTNHIIARNAAEAGGFVGGLFVTGGVCSLANCSIVDNDPGTNKEGLAFTSKDGTHSAHNVIVAGHSMGVYADSGVAVTLDYNDYYDNDANLTGVSAGAHDLTIDPQFRDRAGGDYHLSAASGLVDAGRTEADVTEDFEGDPRPRGAAYDIGADESYLSSVYVSVDSGSDTTGDGAKGNPFATITKAVSEVESNGSIYVAQGTYPGLYILNRTVQLKGGYEDVTWTRDIKNHHAILHGEGLGCVIRIEGYFVHALVEGFTITGGRADLFAGPGGGITIKDDAFATIRYNRITGNIGENEAGGVWIYNSGGWPIIIERNRIYGNESLGNEFLPMVKTGAPPVAGGFLRPGGGLLISGGPTRVVNNFIYNNIAARGGDGVSVVYGENVRLLHNTIANNGLENGEGINLSGGTSCSYAVYNNIISGHHIGVRMNPGPVVDRDYNCYFENYINRFGDSSAPHEIGGDPYFADPESGDFHIRQFSAALNAANTAPEYAAVFDIDGDARPNGAGSDIGADEMYNSPPMFQFLTPSRLDSAAINTFVIRWEDHDYDDDAQIRLYWDTDNKHFDGTMINGVISEDSPIDELAWDTSGLSEGLYYIHVNVTDGVNDPIIKYAPYPVVVTRVTLEEMIDHILKRSELPVARQPYANLNNDSGVDVADYVILLNLP